MCIAAIGPLIMMYLLPDPCSDGVGRTGTFICLHSQLERLKTEGVVDLFQAVKSARIHRAGLVQNAVRDLFLLDFLCIRQFIVLSLTLIDRLCFILSGAVCLLPRGFG